MARTKQTTSNKKFVNNRKLGNFSRLPKTYARKAAPNTGGMCRCLGDITKLGLGKCFECQEKRIPSHFSTHEEGSFDPDGCPVIDLENVIITEKRFSLKKSANGSVYYQAIEEYEVK